MDKPSDHTDRSHAVFAPSGAARWMACHGSIAASEGIESKSNAYAEEGTECHEAAADILMGMNETERMMGLSEDQQWIVGEYVDYAFDTIDMLNEKFSKVKVWIEERVTHGKFTDYHGTGDLLILAGRTLGVIDLKAGFVPVVVRYPNGKLNPQLASYAILALSTHDLWEKVDKVRLTIVQPRVYAEPQTVTVSVEELIVFEDEVITHIQDIQRGDETRVAGDHCKYCPARGRCQALRNFAVTKAKVIFDDPKPARNYEPEELEAILNEAEIIQTHIDGVRAHAKRELEKGRSFPGYKLVPKRAVSKWTDWDNVRKLIEPGTPYEDIFNLRPKSPAKIAKFLGVPVADLSEYFVKESSGTTLARMNDPRDAVKANIFNDDD